MSSIFYGPQKTSGEPAATEVQPDIASPILPAPIPLTKTVGEPTSIGAEWGRHTGMKGGFKCTVFTSPCLDQGIPLTKTFGDPSALVIPEQ